MTEIIILLLLEYKELYRDKELNAPFLCSHNTTATFLLSTYLIYWKPTYSVSTTKL